MLRLREARAAMRRAKRHRRRAAKAAAATEVEGRLAEAAVVRGDSGVFGCAVVEVATSAGLPATGLIGSPLPKRPQEGGGVAAEMSSIGLGCCQGPAATPRCWTTWRRYEADRGQGRAAPGCRRRLWRATWNLTCFSLWAHADVVTESLVLVVDPKMDQQSQENGFACVGQEAVPTGFHSKRSCRNSRSSQGPSNS